MTSDLLEENQDLRKRNKELIALINAERERQEKCDDVHLRKIADLEKENAVLERRIERAKECMKKLLFIINSDPANYNCKGLVKDAEDFIHKDL